jgi:hypothetical protein
MWGRGGGIFLKYTQDAIVNGNTVLLNISSTAGEGEGGGLYLMQDSHVTLYGNQVQENLASTADEGFGGGLWIWFSDPFTLTNNLVTGNRAITEGSGLFIMGRPKDPAVGSVCHTTITDNSGSGQGVFVGDYTTLTFTNNLIAGHSNVSITATANSTLTIRYNLFWGNGSDPITGTEAVVGDPLFVDPAGWDYHLQAGSAAIDTGDPASVLPPSATDLDGNPREVDGNLDGTAVVDIGTYEFQPETHFLPLIMKNIGKLRSSHWGRR